MRRTSLPWRAAARAALAGALILALGGAASAARTKEPTWRSLHRPLHIPRIAPGAPCPTSKPDPRGDLSRFGGFTGPAWGRGPAYPALQDRDGKPALEFVYPPSPTSGFAGSQWSGQKVMWVLNPAYHGRVLIRGRQLDGPNELRFDRGLVPPREKRVVGGGLVVGWASFTRLRADGCYGYQIDGKSFSRVIVFEARIVTSG
jgi:hypothetical protein